MLRRVRAARVAYELFESDAAVDPSGFGSEDKTPTGPHNGLSHGDLHTELDSPSPAPLGANRYNGILAPVAPPTIQR